MGKKIITLIIALLIIFTTGYLYTNKENPWQKYENKELGISLEYPKNYEINEQYSPLIIIQNKYKIPFINNDLEGIEIKLLSNTKNLSAEQFAKELVVPEMRNTNLTQTTFLESDAWIKTSQGTSKEGSNSDFYTEDLVTKLQNKKILLIGVIYTENNTLLHENYKKILQTVKPI